MSCSALVLKEVEWACGDVGGCMSPTSSSLGWCSSCCAEVSFHPKNTQPAGMTTGCHLACQGHGCENHLQTSSCPSKLDSLLIFFTHASGRGRRPRDQCCLRLSSCLPGSSQGEGRESRDVSVLTWFLGGECWD